MARVRNVHEESDSDDEEEYSIKRDDLGRPFYGPHRPQYLDSEDAMDCSLSQQDYLDPFNKVCVWNKLVSYLGTLPVSLKNTDWKPNYSRRNTKEEWDRKWYVNVKVVDPFGNAFERGYETKETDRKVSGRYKLSDIMSPNTQQVYAPCVVDWSVLTKMGCVETIEAMLEIKVIEVGGNEEFNEEVTGEELSRKKIIRFRLGGRKHYVSLLEFARYLGLYKREEILEEGFEVYFQGGVLLTLLGVRFLGFAEDDHVWFMSEDDWVDKEEMNGYTRGESLDTTTLKELIGPDGMLIAEDPAPEVPRFAMPRPPCPTLQDISDRMGHIEIRRGVLERMSCSQLYHSDRYARVFEHMAGNYGVPLDGEYAPPDYDEQQQ
ncbi:hypothetical protein Tco_1344001 [Tanacetum coccineum]